MGVSSEALVMLSDESIYQTIADNNPANDQLIPCSISYLFSRFEWILVDIIYKSDSSSASLECVWIRRSNHLLMANPPVSDEYSCITLRAYQKLNRALRAWNMHSVESTNSELHGTYTQHSLRLFHKSGFKAHKLVCEQLFTPQG
jgi:hypothetical protein